MFKIINYENEHNEDLNKKGQTSELKTDSDISVTPVANNINSGGSSSSNSSLLYIIIGLLAIMVLLLGYFIFVKKGSKKILFLILLSGFGFNTSFAQSSDDPAPVDFGALLVSKAEFNALVNELRTTNDLQYSNIDDNYRLIDQNRDKIQMIEEWVQRNLATHSENWNQQSEFNADINDGFNILKDQFNQFRNDFVDLEGDLNEINSKLSSLEAQVEFLSARDRNYAPQDQHESRISLPTRCPTTLGEERISRCLTEVGQKYNELIERFRELNRIMKHNNWVVETGIATGNALANSAPGMGLGWQKQLEGTQRARRKLYRTYNDKYDELESLISVYTDQCENCYQENECSLQIDGEMVSRTGSTGDGITIGVNIQNQMMDRLESSAPRMVTPIF